MIKKIIELHKAGLSKIEIIEKTKYSKTSVYRILANSGFGEKKYPEISADTEQQILDLYASGIGAKLICDRLGIERTRSNIVYRVLAKKGIDTRQKRISPLLSLIPKVVDLYNQGLGCTTIATTLEISKSAATKYIAKYCNVRPKKHLPIRSKRERDRLFMSELDYFNRVAYCEWKSSDKRISFEDFKQSAYESGLRAAELWAEKATYRTYAVKCIKFGFIKLYKDNPLHFQEEYMTCMGNSEGVMSSE